MRTRMEMDEIRALVGDIFRNMFGEIDLIEVKIKPDRDWEGDKILNIIFVFDGAKTLDAERGLELGLLVRAAIVDDEDRFPIIKFLNKEDAKVMKIGNAA